MAIPPIQIYGNFSNIRTTQDFQRFVSSFSQQVLSVVNQAVAQLNSYRLVYGRTTINLSNLVTGAGFSVIGGSGVNRIVFDEVFSNTPTVITGNLTTGANNYADTITTTGFLLHGANTTDVSFLAIGS